MKFDGHRALARQIAASVPAVQPYLEELKRGSLHPDHIQVPRRHHSFGRNTLHYHHLVEHARRLRLAGRPGDAAFQLGVFLHYLADDAVGYPGWDCRHADYESAVGWWLNRERPVSVAVHYGHQAVAAHRYRGVTAQASWVDGRRVRPERVVAKALVGLGAQTAAAVFEPECHADDVAWLAACEAHRSLVWRSAVEVLRGDETDHWRAFLQLPLIGPRFRRRVRLQQSRRRWWYQLNAPTRREGSVATAMLAIEALTGLVWLAARPLGLPLAATGIALGTIAHALLVHRLTALAGCEGHVRRTWLILSCATTPVFLAVMAGIARARVRISS